MKKTAFFSGGACLLFFLIITICNEGAHAGNVTPMSADSGSRSSVTPLTDSPVKGSVRPLVHEDPDVRKVIAEGTATIYGGNAERARLSALRSAYAEAVGRVTGIDIGSLLLVRNVKQVSEVVMTRSKGFIKSYKILKDGISDTDPSRYEVLIEAEVVARGTAKGTEDEGLRLYLELLGNPRLLIMLPEKQFDPSTDKAASESSEEVEVQSKDTKIKIKKNDKTVSDIAGAAGSVSDPISQGSIMQSAEAAVAQAFSVHGYQVITSDDLLAQGLVDPEVLRQAKSGVTAQAVKVAKAAGADIALFGVIRVSATKVKPAGVALVMVSSEASAKALIVSSGRIVQAFHKTERASAPEHLTAYSDSLDRVANSIADVLAWKLPHILTEDSRESRLTVHGIDAGTANKLRSVFIESPGIESARFIRLPSQGNSTAEYLLLTGFVMMAPDEILEISKKGLGEQVTIIKSNKYETELSYAGGKSL